VSLLRHITRGLYVLTHRRAADQDIADEVQHYLDQLAAEGGSPRNATMVREQVRSFGWENLVDQVLVDVPYAARRLRASPAFTTVSAITLAVGIGASTAIFSAVNPILFEPLPYPDASRMLMISDRGPGGNRADVTFGTFAELAARSRSFGAVAVVKPWQPTLISRAEPERLDGQRVSASYFATLGWKPRLGSDFDAADDRPHGPDVAIVSNALWQRRLNADPAIVGQQITLDGDRFTVIGVMPAGFDNVLAPSAQVWSLLQYESSAGFFGAAGNHDTREWGHHLTMVARVRSGWSVDAARRELATLARTPSPDFARPFWASLSDGLIVHALQDDVTSGVRPVLLAILGAVLLVLAIACVNVTNLVLARGAQRRGELAMRAALGAGRGRIVRQLVTESLLLALLGGALGLGFAVFGTRALVALSPPELPRVSAIGINGGVFLYASGVTTICGVLIGLIPALQDTRHLRRATQRRRSLRSGLVVTEVALALVLLVGAGLLLRSLNQIFGVSPGFMPSHMLTMQVQEVRARDQFFAEALEAVRRVPGVTSAAFTSQLPLSGEVDGYGAHMERGAAELLPTDQSSGAERAASTRGGAAWNRRTDESGDYGALRYTVSPGYVQTMGIALRRGRLLDEHDVAGQLHVVLVSESFARRNLPGQDPIGQRLRLGPDTTWATIVGVVTDVKQLSLAGDQTDAVYNATSQWMWVDPRQSLVLKTPGDAAALASAVKAAIWSVDKSQPIVRVATMDDLVARSEAQRRFALTVFELFGLVALALAAIGLYGVLSGSVTERLREIGVRTALGASPADILTLIVRQGMTLAALGVVLGLCGAIAASRAITTLLFGVSSLDPTTYLGVIVVLLGVSGLACWLPAQRASGVAPLTALRPS
jgi:putative ABC transport system permease protein